MHAPRCKTLLAAGSSLGVSNLSLGLGGFGLFLLLLLLVLLVLLGFALRGGLAGFRRCCLGLCCRPLATAMLLGILMGVGSSST